MTTPPNRTEPERRRAPRLVMGLAIEVLAELRDLSQSGAFIVGSPLPLLSRVQFRFTLAGLGEIDTLGWVLWRRLRGCTLPASTSSGDGASGGAATALPAGFGVLFEAIALKARLAVTHLIARAVAAGKKG